MTSSITDVGNLAGSTSNASATTGASGFDRLGKQEFLKLLVAQLKNQDPMKPVDNQEFVAQLAQFAALETMQNLDKRLEELAQTQALGQAAGLLGKNVQARLADGTTLSGTVSQAQVAQGAVKLVVNGQTIGLDQIVTVGG